jgi:anti-sigma regulatory factor (Ser/Thr protein kinase)
VSTARHLVRSFLIDLGVEGPVTDDASLLVTELVANAVFHAGGSISLRVALADGRPPSLRLEVSDGSPSPPVERSYGTGASTGRGLALVAHIARRWGVDRRDGGKTVWAELPLDGSARTDEAAAPESTMPARGARTLPAGSVLVRYLAVPVATYLQLQEQNDAILRELELLAGAEPDGGTELSPRLVDVIERSRRHFNAVREGFRADVMAAAEAARTSIDLDGSADPSGIGPAREFVSLLEDVERLAADGELLVSPPAGDVARLRRWFVEQMTVQVQGGEATAFS